MISTPRTDEEELVAVGIGTVVYASFAQQLERELHHANENATCAWKTTKASDKALMEEMLKRDEAVVLLKECDMCMAEALLAKDLRDRIYEFIKKVENPK